MRGLIAAMGAMLVGVWTVQGQEGHHHELSEEEVGSVHFATTCGAGMNEAAKTEFDAKFNRAVALLHSFQYEEARQAFFEISANDRSCAMSRWGIAMSYYHGLWKNGDTDFGRDALEIATVIAGMNPKTTPRELAYLDALSEIYRKDGKDSVAHDLAFEQKMRTVQEAYPADREAAIFHALTLDITAPKTDKTFANQRKCGEILEPIFKEQPHHPGVAHYIIHCYDNPVLAQQGLGAARMYAKIAPVSAHANHMPSHIFTRVGSWDESIVSNMKSAEIAAAREKISKNGEARDQRLHAMDYLEYAYLQTGQAAKAKAVLDQMRSFDEVQGLTLTGNYATGAIPARYAIELKNWDETLKLEPMTSGVPWARALVWEAIGEGSAMSGKLERAALAEKNLAELRDEAERKSEYWSKQIEVQRLEVSAWLAEQSGKPDEAMAAMRAAATLEESMDKDAVTPGPVTPAREMLAEMLTVRRRDKEALAEYEAVLKVAPKRFNALYGAAVAANRSGNDSAAMQYFRELIETAKSEERFEVGAARAKLAEMAKARNVSN